MPTRCTYCSICLPSTFLGALLRIFTNIILVQWGLFYLWAFIFWPLLLQICPPILSIGIILTIMRWALLEEFLLLFSVVSCSFPSTKSAFLLSYACQGLS